MKVEVNTTVHAYYISEQDPYCIENRYTIQTEGHGRTGQTEGQTRQDRYQSE